VVKRGYPFGRMTNRSLFEPDALSRERLEILASHDQVATYDEGDARRTQVYHIIHGKALLHILPLLSNLQCLQILLGPASPKLFDHVLHLFPSLLSVG